MPAHYLPFGGHGSMVPAARALQDNSWRRIFDATAILGPGGHVAQSQIGQYVGALSPEEQEIAMKPYRFFAGRGLDSHYHFQWPRADGLKETEKTQIIDTLRYFAAHPEAGLGSLRLGNEIEGFHQAVGKYRTDLLWLLKEMDDLGLAVPVFGPSVSAHPVVEPPNPAVAMIDAFFSGGVPVSANQAGIDVHRFVPTLISIEDEPGIDPFYQCAAIARANGKRVMAGEFCGCTWGLVTFPDDGSDYCWDEGAQAWVGLSNVLRAMAKEVDTIYWSHFPWDVAWNAAVAKDLRNHTGMCVGPNVSEENYDAAGGWRHLAYVYQFMAESWRKYQIASTGVVASPNPPDSMVSLYNFAATLDGQPGLLYAFHRNGEADHVQVTTTIDMQGKSCWYQADLSALAWQGHRVPPAESVEFPVGICPSLILVA